MAEKSLAPKKQSSERYEISKELIKAGLTALSGTYGKEVSSALLESWNRALEDLSPEEIYEGFKRVEKTFVPTSACPFPVPAHLREKVDTSRANQTEVEAEAAWVKVTDWVRRYYRPDCRDMKYPELPELLWRALLSAGGPAHVSDCSEDDLAWAKKRFIEAYVSLEQLKQDRNFIGSGEAKNILSQLVQEFNPDARRLK